MTAIIPAAGLGTRFLPLTRAVPKEMLPIGNRPALQLILDEAFEAGADEAIVIISHAKELIRTYFSADPAYGPRIRWVYQEEQRGLGHAVLQTAELLSRSAKSKSNKGESDSAVRLESSTSSFLILLGDALVSGCRASSEMVALSKANGGASVIGCERVPPEKVSRYGILKVEDGRVVDMVEKPSVEEAPSDLAVAGRYLLDVKIFDFLKTQAPGKGGEIQLTDAIRRMISLSLSHPLTLSPSPSVYDDYAHNPEKLKAMWTTLAEKHPAGICVIWRPHGYAPLRKMMDALAAMFVETVRPCDKLLLLPVYDAGGTTDRSVNSNDLKVKVEGEVEQRIELIPDLDAAYEWCAAHKGDFSAFVTCGARDPSLPILAKRLSEM